MTASSVFTNVMHDISLHCCYPTGGSVKTTFAGGANDGKFETATFSAATCALGTMGQVSFVDVNGTTSTKTLTHCL
jgi:hypothetical protein